MVLNYLPDIIIFRSLSFLQNPFHQFEMDTRKEFRGCLHTQEPLYNLPPTIRPSQESPVVLASALGFICPLQGWGSWWAANLKTALTKNFSGDYDSHSVLKGWKKVGSCLTESTSLDSPWLLHPCPLIRTHGRLPAAGRRAMSLCLCEGKGEKRKRGCGPDWQVWGKPDGNSTWYWHPGTTLERLCGTSLLWALLTTLLAVS